MAGLADVQKGGEMARSAPAVLIIILPVYVVAAAVACDQSPTRSRPEAPTPLPSSTQMASVSGTAFIHDEQGVRPYADASLFSWLEEPTRGGPAGQVFTDSAGNYVFRAPVGSRFRIFFGWTSPAYQPCAVTLAVTGDVRRDVAGVIDERQLGAGLPLQLRSQSPTLSGVVFDATSQEVRTLGGVRIDVDGTGSGGDVLTASTLTDSDGRFVVCGLELDTATGISASKPGYRTVGKWVSLTGDATALDIELQRQ